jgi:hypothetical protein
MHPGPNRVRFVIRRALPAKWPILALFLSPLFLPNSSARMLFCLLYCVEIYVEIYCVETTVRHA